MKKLACGFMIACLVSGAFALQAADTSRKAPPTPKGGIDFSGEGTQAECYIFCSNGEIWYIEDTDFFGCWDACEAICGEQCVPIES